MKALIMAGGQGTRFWPLSRELYPKQLLKLGVGKSLIQETVLRLDPLVKPKDVHIVTNKKLLSDISSQLSEIGLDAVVKNILLEPEPKNTAPAVGLSAVILGNEKPDTVMAVLPADHVIADKKKYHAALRKAEKLAESGRLVVFGIRPSRPETGYGYIKMGGSLERGAWEVERFVEKPDRPTAEGYLLSGEYLWNSGMFVWRADVILEEMKRLMPELYRSLKKISAAAGKPTEAAVLAKEFAALKSVSIDYGVMEKSDRVVVVPVDFGWSDLGSWDAISDVIPADANGNVIVGTRVVNIDCRDTVFYTENRLVAAIGLNDAIVVDTPDATLVCRKDMAQRVKEVVAELKDRGFHEHITHQTVQRPWGSYTVLLTGPNYKIKTIEVKPGAKLSHQMHHHRSEHWVVVSGTALVTRGDELLNVHVNESTYIPVSTKHRLENPGKVPLRIIEVQNGEYLEEDDIVRFDDDYGREG